MHAYYVQLLTAVHVCMDVQDLLEKEGSGLKVLLLNNMHDDISRMFRLFSRITGMHNTLYIHTY